MFRHRLKNTIICCDFNYFHFYLLKSTPISPINPKNAKKAKKIARLIQRGAVTHHHDQSITLVSLSTRNTMNKIIDVDVPEDFVVDIILSF